MTRIIPLIVMSLVLSACGILDGFFQNEAEPISDAPPVLTVLLDEPVNMNQGTYCWTGEEAGICVDMIPPVYDTSDHITVSGDSLSLQFANTPPDTLSAYLHPGSNLMTRIADIQLESTLNVDGSVTISMPEQLSGDYVLVVSAQWQEKGDSMYSLPIRVD